MTSNSELLRGVSTQNQCFRLAAQLMIRRWNWYKDGKGLRSAILLGTALVVIFYLVWQISIMGNLDRDALQVVISEGGNIGALLRGLEANGVSTALSGTLQIFSNFAVATSFLGVSLSLFDDSLSGRIKTAAIIFIPPTVLGIMIPAGFIRAIGFAGFVSESRSPPAALTQPFN